MSATTALLRGRLRAENLMVDTCHIQRRSGSTTDQDTGATTPTYTDVYTGKCRFQMPAPAASPQDVGQEQVFTQQTVLQLPMTVTGVQNEDIVTCTASTLDPDLVGRKYWVKGVLHKTHATSRRLALEEVE